MANKFRPGWWIFLLVIVVSLCAGENLYAEQYYYYDLGTLGGNTSAAYGINDSGQIVGGAQTATGSYHAFFLKNPGQAMQDLGTLGGDDSYAKGINNSGQIVGAATTDAYGGYHAFLKNPGQAMQDLGILGVGGDTKAEAINNSGQIVGYARTPFYGPSHAFLTNPGQPMQDLGTLGADSAATGINKSGQIVGEGRTTTYGPSHAFLMNPGQPMQDLGTLGGSWSYATGINNSGQIVGSAQNANNYRAFLKNPGQPMQDLGTLGGYASRANGINNSGQIVGYSYTASGDTHGFIKNLGQALQDLNALTVNLPQGVTLSNANAISDTGYIVGLNSLNHAFSLSPAQISLNLPKPTATPDAPAFLTPSNLFPGAVSFIKNNASSFSEPSQQFLNNNLNSVERFMVKHTSGPGWKFAFSFGEEFSKNLGFVMSVNSVCAAFAENPLAGTFALGEFAGKDLLYKAAGINNDYQARLFIDSSILAAKSSIGMVTPISFLSSLNNIIWGDILAGQFAQLANDPPDLNFKEIFQSRLAYNAPFNFAGVSSGLNRLLGLEFGSVYETYYLMEGMTTSINRYSSALSAGDTASAGLQFEAFIKYLTLYDSSAIQTADYMKQLRQALIDQGMTDFYYDKQALLDLQNQIRLNGLPQDLIDYYKSLGLTDSDIAAMKQAMLDFIPPDSLSGSLYSNLSDGSNLLLYESSSSVPLPSSIYLFLPGFIGILAFRRKIRKG